MELSLTHTLTTVELNHMIDLLVHFLREQLLEHILASYIIVRECNGSNRLILFTGPTNLDITYSNHVAIILVPQFSTNDRFATDGSLGIFCISQLYVVNFRLQRVAVRQDAAECLFVSLTVTLQILSFC